MDLNGAIGMAIDFKKTQRELYQPNTSPSIVDVPEMTFFMIDGHGDPNSSGEYKTALEILYGLSYGVKMSKRGSIQPEGYFDYVVPPLEGLWWFVDCIHLDSNDKDKFCWTSMIRQPDFVTENVFGDVKREFSRKKPELELSAVYRGVFSEGQCAQATHVGSYDSERETIEALERFITESGFIIDLSEKRRHHEIYLGDPRKTGAEKLKTIIRLPVLKVK